MVNVPQCIGESGIGNVYSGLLFLWQTGVEGRRCIENNGF